MKENFRWRSKGGEKMRKEYETKEEVMEEE